MTMTVTVEFTSMAEAQRVLYLLHQDLAKTEGAIVLANQTLEAAEAGERIGGNKRERAEATLRTAPKQAAVIRAAQKAVKVGVEAANP